MTKDQLQKELKDKVKPGVKPSDLRKLKRSKSADDIPSAPTSIPVSRSKSTEPFKDPKYPYTTLISQQEELDKLKKETTAKSDTIKLLRQKIEELETKDTPANSRELDNSLLARHKNLKDWFSQYQKTKQLDKELAENVEEASSELEKQGEVISQLRKEVSQLARTNQSLQKDLNLSSRLAELRKSPFPSSENYPYLKLALYTLLTVWFSWMLVKNFSSKK